jgi:hypothetical protein
MRKLLQSGASRRCRLTKRLYSRRLVSRNVKDRIQLCDLHHILDLVIHIEQLQFPALLS